MSKIIQGDCIEEMKKLDKNSVDAVVTDPPYGLNFMGKSWDDFEPKEFQEFSQKWGEQALRVLKPGGYLLAFCGTRTYHRMVVGLEDAGFTIKDQIDWLYGCLSEDTEILTTDGWKGIDEISEKDRVYSYDYETNQNRKNRVQISSVNHVFRYDIDDEMVHLKNDNTDQLLTKNHKVLCKIINRKQTDGERNIYKSNIDYRYIDAGQIRKASRITLPLGTIYDGDKSIGGELFAELVGLVLTEGWYQGEAVNISQSSVNDDIVKRIRYILGKLNASYSKYKRERVYKDKNYTEHQFYITGEIAEKIQNIIPDNKPIWDLFDIPIEEKEHLYKGLMDGDGSGNAFYQNDLEFLEWFQILCHFIGKQARINENKMCVSVHHNPTTEIQGKHRKNDIVAYKGRVWCINTDYGNFFARRNGKIFITGNSGFPKSHDISKAIDKHFDKEDEREKEKVKYDSPDFRDVGKKSKEAIGIDKLSFAQVEDAKRKMVYETKPATKEAKKWQGWGTALKPSHEPIVVAQKPRDGTYASNTLLWETGGLNIDGCRIGNADIKTHGGKKGGNAYGDWEDVIDEYHKGRWPANVILDPVSAEMLDQQSGYREPGAAPKTQNNRRNSENSPIYGVYDDSHRDSRKEYDGGGASRFFYSAKAHKSERNSGLEDLEEIESGVMKGSQDGSLNEWGDNETPKVKNDIATLKPISLMRYLCRLVTPEDGTVLDPFAGSGTTGCACEIEGFDYILIEKRERFANIIAPKRIEYWSKEKNWKELKEHTELPNPKNRKRKKLTDFLKGDSK